MDGCGKFYVSHLKCSIKCATDWRNSCFSHVKMSLNSFQSPSFSESWMFCERLDKSVDDYIAKEETGWRCTYQNCHQKFFTTQRVKEHVRTHLGVRPYLCLICQYGFKHCGSLYRHLRMVHAKYPPEGRKCYSYSK